MMTFYLLMLSGVAAGYYGGIGLLKALGKPDGSFVPIAGALAGGVVAYVAALTVAPPMPRGDIVWAAPVQQVFSQEEMAALLEEEPEKPTLVSFYADWCAPCHHEAPSLNALALAGERVAVVDVDRAPSVADRYGVVGLPSALFFLNGREVHREVGYTSKRTLQKRLDTAAGS